MSSIWWRSAVLAVAALVAGAAFAQDWPKQKPVQFLVGFGHTQISSTSVPPAVPQVKAGKVRAIAVTSAQRSPALPDVPTLNEQGLSGFDDLTWFAFFAPAGTPGDVVPRLNAEVNRILELPDVKEKLGQLGLEFRRNTPEEFGAYLREEIPKWAKAVKDSGAKAD